MGTDKLVFAGDRTIAQDRSDVSHVTGSDMTGSDVRHVTGSEPVRKYVMRMYNRKLRNIRPSWAF